jgi:phosphatidate cytidylyltransferase
MLICASGSGQPTDRGGWRSDQHVPALSLAACVVFAAFAGYGIVGGLAFLVLVVLPATLVSGVGRKGTAPWRLAGAIYVGLPALALLLLRALPGNGMELVLWVLGLTVAADTLAYVAGRGIGGPKLAPRISPNKTWAGLAGAIAGAALMGALASTWLGAGGLWKLTFGAAALGVVEQAGDLVESAFKRHFGVKDSSGIIPGHGGVLDRVDGLLAVGLAVAAIILLRGGAVT